MSKYILMPSQNSFQNKHSLPLIDISTLHLWHYKWKSFLILDLSTFKEKDEIEIKYNKHDESIIATWNPAWERKKDH